MEPWLDDKQKIIRQSAYFSTISFRNESLRVLFVPGASENAWNKVEMCHQIISLNINDKMFTGYKKIVCVAQF